jgi:hypothetical protein
MVAGLTPNSLATCTRAIEPAARTLSNTCWRSGRSKSGSGGISGPTPFWAIVSSSRGENGGITFTPEQKPCWFLVLFGVSHHHFTTNCCIAAKIWRNFHHKQHCLQFLF